MAKIVVPGHGSVPASWMVVGEAPGVEEARVGRPFVGKSGLEQAAYLKRYGVDVNSAGVYLTNVVCEYQEGNPDPTVSQIEEWTPKLIADVHRVDPKVIVAVGRFAMRWFLGEEAELDVCGGMPHWAGQFDARRTDRAPIGCYIVPVMHPAAGFYDGDARAVIDRDYHGAADVLKRVVRGEAVEVRRDPFDGVGRYVDATGAEVARWAADVSDVDKAVVALDTEGTPDDPWAIQVSNKAGTALVLRRSQADFAVGVDALQFLASSGATFVMHNALYDLEMCQAMGLKLAGRAKLWDTMYAAYLLRLEPQGLKQLAWRWCGVRMTSYMETLGNAAETKRLDYLAEVLGGQWPTPEARVNLGNDGVMKLYKPQPIEGRVVKILLDFYARRGTDDPVDLAERWWAVDDEQRQAVESKLGPLPFATLSDIPLAQAINYSARDADVTLRLHGLLSGELFRRDQLTLMAHGMDVLPAFFAMQTSGMPASRTKFEVLRDEMSVEMAKLQAFISTTYYEGKPFNPKSPKHVGVLMRRRGLESAKRTSTGAVSTGKLGIEHLRYGDPAINDILTWREMQHTRDMFCESVLALMPEGVDRTWVKCRLKTTRTHTRRLASADPNLLAFPKHEKPGGRDFGKRVRDCFEAADGWQFLECDLSQIELRMFAHESADEVMCRLYSDPKSDIHTATAARLFGCKPEDVTKTQRFFAKRVNFGIPYGVSGEGMATQLRVMGIEGWSSDICERAIREWHRLYVGGSSYIKRVENETGRTGVVKDCWSMTRYLPAVWADDSRLAAEARRQAVNHKIQGGAQGLLQRSIAWLYPRIQTMIENGVQVRWCLTIHDSLLLLVGEGEEERVTRLVLDGMMNHGGMKLRVPVLADHKVGKSWGAL